MQASNFLVSWIFPRIQSRLPSSSNRLIWTRAAAAMWRLSAALIVSFSIGEFSASRPSSA